MHGYKRFFPNRAACAGRRLQGVLGSPACAFLPRDTKGVQIRCCNIGSTRYMTAYSPLTIDPDTQASSISPGAILIS